MEKAGKGFTLIEALIAAAILAIGLIGAGAAIYSQFNFISQIRERAIATLAAQEEIEIIRGLPFDQVRNLPSSFIVSGFTYLRNAAGMQKPESISSDGNLQRVTVTVSWRSFSGKTLQQTLATLMTRNGINKQ